MAYVEKEAKKLDVYVNNYDYGDAVYIALNIKCGFCYRYIHYDGENQIKELNLACANVFCNYITLFIKKKFFKVIKINITQNVITMALRSNVKKFSEDIKMIYQVLFDSEFEDELFTKALATSIKNFKKNYNDIEFRGLYHMLEFTESGKGFAFGKLTDDFLKLDNKIFTEYWESLIIPGNSILLVSGNVEDVSALTHLSTNRLMNHNAVPRVASKVKNTTLQSDKKLTLNLTSKYELGAMKFYFINEQVTMEEKYFFLNILGERLFSKCNIHIDYFDTSIIYHGEIKKYKENIVSFIETDKVELSAQKLLRLLAFWQKDYPIGFHFFWGALVAENINLNTYIDLLSACTSQQLVEIYTKSNMMITEAQITCLNKTRR